MTEPTQKYSEKIDAAFEAKLSDWQLRNLTTIDTPFVLGMIQGLRDEVMEILNDATLTEDSPELD